MEAVIKIIFWSIVIVWVISAERYNTEKDTIEQLTINGRTNFIFNKDISVENVKIIEDKE